MASGDTAPVTSAKGRVATPARSVEYSRTTWKYCVMRKMKPNSPKKASAIAPLAALKRGLRNSRTSSSGSGRRSSQVTKPTSATTAAAYPPRVRADAQPLPGASIVVHTSRPIPTMEPTAPSGSNRPGPGVAALGQDPEPGEQGDGGHGQVHPQHRAPREVLEQQAAADRAQGDARGR